MQTRNTNHHGPWLLVLCLSTVLIASCGSMRAYRSNPEVASSSDEEIEESLTDFVDKLRKERKQRKGSSKCLG